MALPHVLGSGLLTPSTINVILNLVGIILGGTALGVILRYSQGMRGLRDAESANIRDHYAKEVERLTQKLDRQTHNFHELEKHWREMLEASDHRHEECEKARAESRAEMDAMHDQLRGLKDQLKQYSADTLIMLERNGKPSQSAPESLKAAERIKKLSGNDK